MKLDNIYITKVWIGYQKDYYDSGYTLRFQPLKYACVYPSLISRAHYIDLFTGERYGYKDSLSADVGSKRIYLDQMISLISVLDCVPENHKMTKRRVKKMVLNLQPNLKPNNER